MLNIKKFKFVQFEPFLNFIQNVLDEKFYSVSESKTVKILEIGCGPGDFSLILKNKLGDKVDITAIDPSDDIEEAISKSNGSDVKFSRGDIFESKFDTKFDVLLFTKSLHHCNPVDKAIKNAFDLLEENGILIAEEFNANYMNTNDKRWCFDRMDLIRATNCLIPVEERLENSGHVKKVLTAFLDTSLPVSERFIVRKDHHHHHGHDHGHGHHQEHQHEHGNHQEHHHEHKHECQGEHHHEHKSQPLHRDDPEGIATYNEIIKVIVNQFEKDNVKIYSVPFFYHLVVMAGLKDTNESQAALQEYYNQEERAIKEKIINPLGLNIIAYK